MEEPPDQERERAQNDPQRCRNSGEFLVVVGVLGMSFVVGWVMKDPLSELRESASPLFRRMAPGAIFTIRYIVPPLVAVIAWLSLRDTLALVFG